jgi:hypothetical protein
MMIFPEPLHAGTDCFAFVDLTEDVTFSLKGGTYNYSLSTTGSCYVQFQAQAPDGTWHDYASAGTAQTGRFYPAPCLLRVHIESADAPISLAFMRVPNVLGDTGSPNAMRAAPTQGFVALEGVTNLVLLEDGDLLELEQ